MVIPVILVDPIPIVPVVRIDAVLSVAIPRLNASFVVTAIVTVGTETYPNPLLPILILLTVPAAETVTVLLLVLEMDLH